MNIRDLPELIRKRKEREAAAAANENAGSGADPSPAFIDGPAPGHIAIDPLGSISAQIRASNEALQSIHDRWRLPGDLNPQQVQDELAAINTSVARLMDPGIVAGAASAWPQADAPSSTIELVGDLNRRLAEKVGRYEDLMRPAWNQAGAVAQHLKSVEMHQPVFKEIEALQKRIGSATEGLSRSISEVTIPSIPPSPVTQFAEIANAHAERLQHLQDEERAERRRADEELKAAIVESGDHFDRAIDRMTTRITEVFVAALRQLSGDDRLPASSRRTRKGTRDPVGLDVTIFQDGKVVVASPTGGVLKRIPEKQLSPQIRTRLMEFALRGGRVEPPETGISPELKLAVQVMGKRARSGADEDSEDRQTVPAHVEKLAPVLRNQVKAMKKQRAAWIRSIGRLNEALVNLLDLREQPFVADADGKRYVSRFRSLTVAEA